MDAASGRDRRDPTGTTAVRKEYEADLVRRFREIKQLIFEAMVNLDVLGLSRGSVQKSVQAQMFERVFAPAADAMITDAVAKPQPKQFAFGTSDAKVSAFMEWLYQQERAGILEVQQGTTMASAGRSQWQNKYIDTAYRKGMRDAGEEIAKGGRGAKPTAESIRLGFSQPIHADAVGLIYTRSFRELEGITDEMDRRISRVLANGMAEGRGPMDVARDMMDEVEEIGIKRARLLARTEITNAHAEASLNSYEEAEIEGVRVMAEFTTAGDDEVCPECEELEGQEFELDEARGMIPVHPNCRCAFLPVVDEPDDGGNREDQE